MHNIKEPNVPQEVIDGFAMIFGDDFVREMQDVLKNQQEVQLKSDAVKEEFFRMLNRIDEAFRFIHNI